MFKIKLLLPIGSYAILIFLEQIEILAKSEVDSIILREKDLSEEEYYVLAKNVLRICEKVGVSIHSLGE